MTKFSIRPRKTVTLPDDIEVEAKTFKEAAFLAFVKLHRDYPNWTDRMYDHTIIDMEIRDMDNPSRKTRNLSAAGHERILVL